MKEIIDTILSSDGRLICYETKKIVSSLNDFK